MTVLAGLVVGIVLGAACRWGLREVLASPVLVRANHRGLAIPAAAGLVLPVTGMVAAGGVALVGLADAEAVATAPAVLAAVIGFALLGLVDDVLGGDGDVRGFRGHARALARGRATTGGLKLAGGAALALAVCAPVSGDVVLRLLGDAALVALSANLANLFDRAPGRALKVVTVAFAVVAVATGVPPALTGVAVVMGAGLALLAGDLGERFMLGDTGANALGATLGLGVVLATNPATRLAVLVVVAALNVAGDAVSFSRVIDAVPLLRAADRAGRRHG